MPGKLIPILFLLVLLPGKAQNKLNSPFSFKDYQNMRTEYINTVKDNPDTVYEKGIYYSKKKLDSVNAIKYDIIKKELIKEGTPASSITEETIKSLENDKHRYSQYAYFTIKKNGYSFFLRDTEVLIINTDKNLKIDYLFGKDVDEESLIHKKTFTKNKYFSLNGQLKRTDTYLIPPSKRRIPELTGISKEYNITGELLFEADWNKEYKHNRQQAIAAGYNFAKQYFLNTIEGMKTNEALAKEITDRLQNSEKEAQKRKSKENIPTWWIMYATSFYMIEITISDKTLQLIDIQYSPIIY